MKCFAGCVAGFIAGILLTGMIGGAFAFVFRESYTNVIQSTPMGIVAFVMCFLSLIVGGDIGNDHDKADEARKRRQTHRAAAEFQMAH